MDGGAETALAIMDQLEDEWQEARGEG
ncbi:hypothetical protein BH760_gp65 [Gordonia phage Splinter]|uniref:Uncharacterized protein n=2 Tax=Vendettavirus vendetta TaxID=2049886 RepID=A0A166Y449_9CAUD|nr:hypothetical protein BH795_gp65 [Gordonia phage Vendetta]YP_009275400.1 hypothetical protein BH760_gp65 [Gordonia phage Splinter]ANA85593.1 hypothetical protein PBI_VENDETTA_46 [Gordonia phage Vendetta]ANA85672.1 hypothetical protein PBI_SPLINTER_46 [Gordonia phage Splinter]